MMPLVEAPRAAGATTRSARQAASGAASGERSAAKSRRLPGFTAPSTCSAAAAGAQQGMAIQLYQGLARIVTATDKHERKPDIAPVSSGGRASDEPYT